jgi:hypothetical protein
MINDAGKYRVKDEGKIVRVEVISAFRSGGQQRSSVLGASLPLIVFRNDLTPLELYFCLVHGAEP